MDKIKPILFNTDMVRAILDDRKTATRRVIKPQPRWDGCSMRWYWKDIGWWYDGWNPVETITYKNTPYQPSDILYVREGVEITGYGVYSLGEDDGGGYVDCKFFDGEKIRFKIPENEYQRITSKYNSVQKEPYSTPKLSPYWLTKHEVRIWLKVTDVRVERLQVMTNDDAISEGIEPHCYQDENGNIEFESYPIDDFAELWDFAIKKKGLPFSKNIGGRRIRGCG